MAAESAEYWCCGDGEQSVLHLYTKMEDGTPSFREKFGQDRDSMAETTKKKMVTELLANKRAVEPLLVYLKDTEVGSREGAVEKEGEERNHRLARLTYGRPFEPSCAKIVHSGQCPGNASNTIVCQATKRPSLSRYSAITSFLR